MWNCDSEHRLWIQNNFGPDSLTLGPQGCGHRMQTQFRCHLKKYYYYK